MSKFNESTKDINKTVNQSGHVAYKMEDKMKLVSQVLTSFFNEQKFYGDNSNEIIETVLKVIKDDPAFISKLAVFARREFNMRSISHVLVTLLAHEPEGKPYVRQTVKGVSLRGDDVTEIMACYLNRYGKPIPNSLKKGINDVLQGFDEYTLAKYKGSNKSVKMRDLLCLCRPTPLNDKQSEMWHRCINNNLQIPYTWESELSVKGNTKEVWEELIDSGKVGYMALLRNLRNILSVEPNNLDKVLNRLQDPIAVKHSKQLPFRFLAAYKEIYSMPQATSKVLNALEKAVRISFENVPHLPGRSAIAIDTSGSMGMRISENSTTRCSEIAQLLGLMATAICDDAITMEFDYELKVKKYTGTGEILSKAMEAYCGGGTDMGLPFEYLMENELKVDRIIIISDNECNRGLSWSKRKTIQSLANEYKSKVNSSTWIHAIDIQGYGTQQFYGGNINLIAGWSEKVLNFILLVEQGKESLLKTIENYKI